jgi:thiol-disulfide isomerase/thioredoxin
MADASPVHVAKSWDEFKRLGGKTTFAVADVYTTWCGPCKTAAPIFVDLAKANPKITFLKVRACMAGGVASRVA